MTTIIERAIYNETHLPKTPSDVVSARKLRRANERVYIRKKQFELKGNVVALHGGHCVICGYDKNQAALEFHHVNAKEKEYYTKGIDEMCFAVLPLPPRTPPRRDGVLNIIMMEKNK